QQPGTTLCIFIEQLVEVAHAIEQQIVSGLGLEAEILLHHGGMTGKIGLCHQASGKMNMRFPSCRMALGRMQGVDSGYPIIVGRWRCARLRVSGREWEGRERKCSGGRPLLQGYKSVANEKARAIKPGLRGG